MLPAKYILWLQDIRKDDYPLVGENASEIGEMVHTGIPLLPGFVITKNACKDFFEENDLQLKLQHLHGSTNLTDEKAINHTKAAIRKYFNEATFSEEFAHEVFHAYELLGGILKHAPVTIRTSSQEKSSESELLYTKGEANVLHHIKTLWTILALDSLDNNSSQIKQTSIMVQLYPQVDLQGTLITTNPQDKSTILINLDKNRQFLINKTSKETTPQIPESIKKSMDNLNLIQIAKTIEQHSYFPQEVNFGIDDERMYIFGMKPFNGNTKSSMANVKIITEHSFSPTATKVFVTLSQPELAIDVAKRYTDGVGLLRADNFIQEIGIHPKEMIKNGKKREYENMLAEKIAHVCEVFSPRPILYRTSDFITTDYRNLQHGDHYEPIEINPLLGFRGAYRYLYDPELFSLEIEALKIVRNIKGLKNVWLLLPFVRTVAELTEIKKRVTDAGLYRSPSFKLCMMVEVPSNVILLDKFIEAGIDGVTIGVQDLTMLTLGVDQRNSEMYDNHYYTNEAVLWSLERVVKIAKKYNIISSFCEQDILSYPELLDKLISWGISNISVTPETIETTREYIAQVEEKLIGKGEV